MVTLKHILEDLKITNESDLRRYIDKNYGKDSKLKILKKRDLGVNAENRVFGEVIKYEYSIIDVPMLDISNSSKISFQDCVFTGDLRIGNREKKSLNIFLNHVCINGYLSVSGADCITDLSLSTVIAKEIRVLSSEIKKFDIFTSRMSSFKMHNSIIEQLSASFNEIGYFQTYQVKFDDIKFSNDQLEIKNQTRTVEELEKYYSEFNCLTYPHEFDYDALSDSEKKYATSETLDFLSTNASSTIDRDVYSEIKYQKGLNSIDNKLQRCLYHISGGLIRPICIVTLIVFSIFVFALVYSYFGLFNAPCLGGLETCSVRGLGFFEALYYSGISFTTIGYGDIYPTDSIGYIAILEGILGVFLSSCLVVSMTRKYIE